MTTINYSSTSLCLDLVIAIISRNPKFNKCTVSIGIDFFMAPTFPTTLSLAGRSMLLTSQITGGFFAGGSIGGMIIHVSIGQLLDFISLLSIMVAMLILLLLARCVHLQLLHSFTHSTDFKQTAYELG